ncbi:hypothetical protein D9M72_249890 [compost metagenome]
MLRPRRFGWKHGHRDHAAVETSQHAHCIVVAVVEHDERAVALGELLLQACRERANALFEDGIGEGQLGVDAIDLIDHGEPDVVRALFGQCAQVRHEVARLPADGGHREQFIHDSTLWCA